MIEINPIGLSPRDPRYPQALLKLFGTLVPPDIWVIGNVELLKEKGVGFCGSRKASERGLEVAADCARQLSKAQVTVISGYAPGVDMASHEAALANGGRTVIVLPEGIGHFRIKKTIKELWDWRRVLVVSQFQPNAIWRADRAMERNRVIVAVSSAVIVLEARGQGGTLHAGYSALQMGKPLFVAQYDEMIESREGNRRLMEMGALPLLQNRATSQAQMREVFANVGLAA